MEEQNGLRPWGFLWVPLSGETHAAVLKARSWFCVWVSPMIIEFLKWVGVWDGLLALCLGLTPGVFRDYTECQGEVSCVQGKSSVASLWPKSLIFYLERPVFSLSSGASSKFALHALT